MPFTYAFDPEARLVRTTARGVIRFDDLASHVQALAAAGLARIPQLIDARQAQHELSSSDMRRLVGLVATLRTPGEHKGRTALVVTRAADYGMARMYGTLAEESDPGFAVFHDLAEAEALATRQ